MVCNLTQWSAYSREEFFFFLIEEASNLPLLTQKGDPAGNITVYIIILGYYVFEEWNNSMNYFKYTCSCNSNISIAPFCLR